MLVARPVDRGAVGVLGRGGQAQYTDVTDLHARPEADGQAGDVGQLEGDVAAEPGVDEAGRGMYEQPQTTQRALALEAGGELVPQRHRLQGRGEHELARMEDERLPFRDVDQGGEIVLPL